MRKTLIDLAKYLKSILPEIQDNYIIDPMFEEVATKEKIRVGVFSYRKFLNHLFDEVITKGEMFDEHKKIAHEYENRTTLSGYYPFMHNVKTILIKIGFYGSLINDAQTLICGNNIIDDKISVSKSLECLRFLSDCGLIFEGIDLNDKKQDVTHIESIKVSYPFDSDMLIGLKVMAIAEVKLGTLDNQDAFFRCDYRILKNDKTSPEVILKDTIRYLSIDVQDFVLELNQRYLDKGLNCVVEIKGYWIFIKYSYKRKELLGINASLNNGYQINIKAENTSRYRDIVDNFPKVLKDVINKGYGCGRKRSEIGHCNGGCRGLLVPIDDSIMELKDDILTWIDQELSCL